MWSRFQMDGPSTPTDKSAIQSRDSEIGTKILANITPMSIKYLLNHDKNTIYGGLNVKFISVVAKVKSVTGSEPKVAYEIEDDTGSTTAYQELNEFETVEIKTNEYYRIIGRLKGDSKEFFVRKIYPVTCDAEVSTFDLEVKTFIEKLEIKQGADDLKNCKGDQGVDHLENRKRELATDDLMDPSNHKVLEPCNINQSANDELDNQETIVFKYITTNEQIERLTKSDIKKGLFAIMQSEMIDQVLDSLMDKGHIYKEDTDGTFRPT